MKDIDDPVVQAVKASLDLPLLDISKPTPDADKIQAAREGNEAAKAEVSAATLADLCQFREETDIIDAIMSSLDGKGESSTAGARGTAQETATRLWQVLRLARTSRSTVVETIAASSSSEEPMSRAKLISEMLRFVEQGSKDPAVAEYRFFYETIGEALKTIRASESV